MDQIAKTKDKDLAAKIVKSNCCQSMARYNSVIRHHLAQIQKLVQEAYDAKANYQIKIGDLKQQIEELEDNTSKTIDEYKSNKQQSDHLITELQQQCFLLFHGTKDTKI